jgi:hypothetical protein
VPKLARLSTGLAVAALAGGCTDGDRDENPPSPPSASVQAPAATAEPARAPRLHIARCPADAGGCRAVTGRVLAIEAVDPDGDGDAHYVLVGGNVTAPGISIVDVPLKLRPRRLPRIGDRVSAAGPVRSGSYKQKQIEAIEIHHERR